MGRGDLRNKKDMKISYVERMRRGGGRGEIGGEEKWWKEDDRNEVDWLLMNKIYEIYKKGDGKKRIWCWDI